jgi:hypothetical protein
MLKKVCNFNYSYFYRVVKMNIRNDQKSASPLFRTGIPFAANENNFSLLSGKNSLRPAPQIIPLKSSSDTSFKNQLLSIGATAKTSLNEQARGMAEMARHPLDAISKTSKSVGMLASAFTTGEGRAALQNAIGSGMKYYRTHWGEGIGTLIGLIGPMMVPLGGGAAAGVGIFGWRGLKTARLAGEGAETASAATETGRLVRLIKTLTAPFSKIPFDEKAFATFEQQFSNLNAHTYYSRIEKLAASESPEAALAAIKKNSSLMLGGLKQDRSVIEALQRRHHLDFDTAEEIKLKLTSIDWSSTAIRMAVEGKTNAVMGHLSSIADTDLLEYARSLAEDGRSALNLRQRAQLWMGEKIGCGFPDFSARKHKALPLPPQLRAIRKRKSPRSTNSDKIFMQLASASTMTTNF